MTAFLKSATVVAAVAAGTLPAGSARAASTAPGTVRIGYGQACEREAGTVAFVLENTDSRRHTVSIAGRGLTPAADGGTVAAARTMVVQFDIGARGTTVTVSVDSGASWTQRLRGCPRGDGDQGMVSGSGSVGAAGGEHAGAGAGSEHAAAGPAGATGPTGATGATGSAGTQHPHPHHAPKSARPGQVTPPAHAEHSAPTVPGHATPPAHADPATPSAPGAPGPKHGADRPATGHRKSASTPPAINTADFSVTRRS